MCEDRLLSVIVPVYNVLPYLAECVESILAQTYAPLEVLLVDDGSTDGSGELCDQFGARDPRVKVLHQANGGLSAARNAGLDAAGGAWIGFVDSDDWILPDMYETLIGACLLHGAQVASCRFRYVFSDHVSAEPDTDRVSVYTQGEALNRLPLEDDVRFEVCPKVFFREAIGAVRFLPGQVFEDIRFARLTFPQVARFVYVDRGFYQYRQKRDGNTNSSFSARKLAILPECDAFYAYLADGGRMDAAHGMEAFTLDHIIRLYFNAAACGAEKQTFSILKKEYRTRFHQARRNPRVRRLRGSIFACSPKLYGVISRLLHRRA